MDPRSAAQARIFQPMLAELRRHWERDRNLPERLRRLLSDRRFGSRDRRRYRKWAYTALRNGLWLAPIIDVDVELATRCVVRLAENESISGPLDADARQTGAPADVREGAQKIAEAVMRFLHNEPAGVSPPPPTGAILPAWFPAEASGTDETEALRAWLTRPPVWLRARGDAQAVMNALADEGIAAVASPVVPGALQVASDRDLEKTAALERGLFEIQDAGSQRVLIEALHGQKPQGRWLDACAGAGGKTLHLADLLEGAGTVDAWEPRPAARAEIARRAQRGLATGIRICSEVPQAEGTYAGVVIDAPCSGSGTWRRAPHLKLCTQPADIAKAAATQGQILDQYAPLAAVGGLVIYATCSLCRSENEGVIEAFVGRHPGFTVERMQTLLPHAHDGDGFFVARLRRN